MTATDTQPQVALHHANYFRAVKSEWIKTRSITSTWILMGVAVALFVLMAWLIVWGNTSSDGFGPISSSEGVRMLFAGNTFVMLIVAIFGSMMITSEFSTGMARNTFSATPRRGAVLGAKATICAFYSLVVGLVGFGLAFVFFAPLLSGVGTSVDFGDPETLRVLLVNQLTFVVVALLSLGLGTLMRSSVGTIFTVVGLLLVLPGVLLVVNNSIANWVGAVLPTSAANSATLVEPVESGSIMLDSTAGLIVLVLWAVVPMVLALVALRVRDI